MHVTSECKLTITVANAAQVMIGPRCYLGELLLSADGPGGAIVGAGTTVNEAGFAAHEGCWLKIGADCMFSDKIYAGTTDHHVIRDASTGERINAARDIEVGDHVWVGKGVHLMKGARIGSGSAIGALALVAGEIEPGCLAVGVPARAVRRGIVWER